MRALSTCCLLAAISLVSGCNIGVRLAGGCYANWDEAWAKRNIKSAKWTGPCGGAYNWAWGKGTLTQVRKDGRTFVYDGYMVSGTYHGEGRLTRPDGSAIVGTWDWGNPSVAKAIDPQGRVRFDGTWQDWNPRDGVLYEEGGATVTGLFSPAHGGMPSGRYSSSVLHAEVREPDGRASWIVGGRWLNSYEAYRAALPQYLDVLNAREAQQRAAAQAAEAARRQEEARRQQESANALVGALTTAAGVYVAAQQPQQPAPAPVPQWQPAPQPQPAPQQAQPPRQPPPPTQQAPQQPAASTGPSLAEIQQRQAAEANALVEQQRQQREAANRQIAMQNAPASKCLSLIPMTQSSFGGFINSCAFGVSVTWCNDGASGQGLGNFSDAIDCRKNSFASEFVPAHGRVAAHTNAPQVYWFACKEPFLAVYGKFLGNAVTASCR